jgi:hypothetical protein
MSNADVVETINALPSTVFVHQTSAIVYAQAFADAAVLARLNEGTALNLLLSQSQVAPGWLPVQTSSGQTGFIKATTKITTREQLQMEREQTRRGYKLGWVKIVMGGVLCLFGCATILAPFFVQHGPLVIYYGAAAGGAGEFLWGLEQVVNVRRGLKEFDALWQEAMR